MEDGIDRRLPWGKVGLSSSRSSPQGHSHGTRRDQLLTSIRILVDPVRFCQQPLNSLEHFRRSPLGDRLPAASLRRPEARGRRPGDSHSGNPEHDPGVQSRHRRRRSRRPVRQSLEKTHREIGRAMKRVARWVRGPASRQMLPPAMISGRPCFLRPDSTKVCGPGLRVLIRYRTAAASTAYRAPTLFR